MRHLDSCLSFTTTGFASLAACVLVGCAAPVDVRSLGTGNAPPAYELRGPTLVALNAQARGLCPGGHQVLRQWERLHRQAADATMLGRWVGKAEEKLGVVENDEAQLLVQCNAQPG